MKTSPFKAHPGAGPQDQAAMGVGRIISSLGLFVGAPSGVTLFVSPNESSKAVQVWIQADKGAKTDEAQLGHRGLHGDPPIANTSSQSIHRKTSLSFIISSPASTLMAEQLVVNRGRLPHDRPPT